MRMKTLTGILSTLLLLSVNYTVNGQHCRLVKQTISAGTQDDVRIGAAKVMETQFYYNSDNGLDSVTSYLGQSYACRYNGDTITVVTYNKRAYTTATYLPDETGKFYALVETTRMVDKDGNFSSNDVDTTVSNYLYDIDNRVVEVIRFSNASYKNSRVKIIWENGNKIAEEFSDNKGKISQRQLYEYYNDKPYQQLYPLEVNTADRTKNLVKRSVLEVGGAKVMTVDFSYEWNVDGLVTKMLSTTAGDSRTTVTTFTYNCR